MTFRADLDLIIEQGSSGLLARHESWRRVRLGDVCAILNGFPFMSSLFNTERGFPLLRIRDVGKAGTETLYDGELEPEFIVQPGELLVGMDGDFRCAKWRGPPALLNQRVCKLTPNERFLSLDFLVAALGGYLSAIHQHTSAITVKHLSSFTIAEIPLALPPRGEQDRIVQVLSSQISRLDDAVATLERVERNLKRYRASVLKSAVEGRLVPTEAALAKQDGRTYEPASALLERILTERRRRWSESGKKGKYQEPTPPDTTNLPKLPEGWCWASVEQLTTGERTSGYGVLVPGPDVPDGVLLIRVGDIRDGRVHLDEIKRIAKSIADKFQRTYLKGNELLLSLVGTIGRTAVVPTSLAGANVARAVGVIPIASIIDCRWVEHWFRSPLNQSRMVGLAHEVARKTLNLEDVRCAVVALPPRPEQTRIVEMVSDLESTFDKSSGLVELSRQRSGRLRQSILKWAFEGKLADQDPTDEPASVLLERIKAERTTAKPAKPATPQRKAAKKRARA